MDPGLIVDTWTLFAEFAGIANGDITLLPGQAEFFVNRRLIP